MNCVVQRPTGNCTIWVKPPNARMVKIAENVIVAWVEDWLARHTPELRAKGVAMWVIEEPRSEARLRG